jgi:hypothetical protein
MHSDHRELTVAAARIAAELHHAEVSARQLTLSAKNAAAIVLRAGSRAAGLKVIASFYDEVAIKTIRLARSINQTAIRLSAVTVSEWRTSNALERLEKARARADDAAHADALPALQSQVAARLVGIGGQFGTHVRQLSSDLQEIQSYTRAIDVVAVTSRIEAQRAGEFRGGLMNMADTIQDQTRQIKHHVARSISLLDHATSAGRADGQ